VLLSIALVASGSAAMLSFWAYYGSHELGQTVAFFVAFGSALLTVWSLRAGEIDPTLLRRLATPLALWVLGSAFLLYLGFFHGGTLEPLATSAKRFSGQLPSDNDIPRFFSDWFYSHGHSGTPPVYPGEWLASDRPPLQIGYAVFERTFGWDQTGLHYEVMGLVMQQLWIVGLWALLVAGGAGRVTRALAMLTVLVSDVAIVNGFFVWPKMLPAAMLLAAAALILTPLWKEIRRSFWGAVLVAALLGLAQLGHGASIFGIVPLALIAAFRGLPSWRWIGVALVAAAVLLVPWSAYQKWGDPPGNRLTKWMIGGVVEIDSRGTGEAIVDTYREVGFGGALHAKAENFVAMAGGGPMATGLKVAAEEAEAGHWTNAVAGIRTILFLYLLPSLGLLLIGLAAMPLKFRLGARDPTEWRLALSCLAAFAIGAVAWGILLFGGSRASTVIHQGSLAIPVFGICAAAVGLRAVLPRFGFGLLVANALLMLAIYAPSLEPPVGTAYSLAAGLIAAICLAGFCAISLRRDEPRGFGVVASAAAAGLDSPA
jgi:hypothetical protein